jgi:hypothetical protein
LPAEIDAEPRTRTVMPFPGLPAFCTTCTPGAFPWSAASTLATGLFTSASPLTCVTALLTSARLAVP